MRVVYFTHSLSSCWNHGNAHFLRGVLRELWDGAAVFVPPGDPAALARALDELIEDAGARASLAAAARERAAQYDVGTMVRGYHNLYQELAA